MIKPTDIYRATLEGDLSGKPRCAPSDECPVGTKVHVILADHAQSAEAAMLADWSAPRWRT